MTEKAKRTGLIIAGILLCAALVIGIAGRFTSAPAAEDPTISDNGPDTKDPLSGRSPGLPGSLSKYGWGGWT